MIRRPTQMFAKTNESRRCGSAALLVIWAVLVAGCGDEQGSGIGTQEARQLAGEANFSAEVSGAVEGGVAGPGIVQFVPPAVAGPRSEDGYFFIADHTGVRDLGITFTIPSGARPDTHALITAAPLEVGEHFEVRVDHSVGNRTDSFELNTRGSLILDAFPVNGSNLAGNRVAGSFEFVTEDSQGRQVSASGRFDFLGR